MPARSRGHAPFRGLGFRAHAAGRLPNPTNQSRGPRRALASASFEEGRAGACRGAQRRAGARARAAGFAVRQVVWPRLRWRIPWRALPRGRAGASWGSGPRQAGGIVGGSAPPIAGLSAGRRAAPRGRGFLRGAEPSRVARRARYDGWVGFVESTQLTTSQTGGQLGPIFGHASTQGHGIACARALESGLPFRPPPLGPAATLLMPAAPAARALPEPAAAAARETHSGRARGAPLSARHSRFSSLGPSSTVRPPRGRSPLAPARPRPLRRF